MTAFSVSKFSRGKGDAPTIKYECTVALVQIYWVYGVSLSVGVDVLVDKTK